MPRKHSAPKSYYRCECCGALLPSKYRCNCPASVLIAKVYETFPGTTDITPK